MSKNRAKSEQNRNKNDKNDQKYFQKCVVFRNYWNNRLNDKKCIQKMAKKVPTGCVDKSVYWNRNWVPSYWFWTYRNSMPKNCANVLSNWFYGIKIFQHSKKNICFYRFYGFTKTPFLCSSMWKTLHQSKKSMNLIA